MDDPIKVLVADDHDVVRSGLEAFLSIHDDIALVGEARDGDDALKLCDELAPDVVLMDLMMPEMNGVEATEAIRRKFPDIQVIALTSFVDRELVKDVIKAGAVGYLMKTSMTDEIIQAIRAAHDGKPTLAVEATEALMKATRQKKVDHPAFTAREIDVLRLLVEGLNNPQIAEKLFISRSTVKFHVSSIFTKMQVNNRTEAVAKAVQLDLLD